MRPQQQPRARRRPAWLLVLLTAVPTAICCYASYTLFLGKPPARTPPPRLPPPVTPPPAAEPAEGWVAVVGASKGIGKAVAEAFCAAGAGVAVTGRSESKARAAAEQLPAGCASRYAAFDLGWDTGDPRGEVARQRLGPSLRGLVISAALNAAAPWNASKVRAVIDVTYGGQVKAYSVFRPLLRTGGHALFVLSNYGQLRKLAKKSPLRRSLSPGSGASPDAVRAAAAEYMQHVDRDCAGAIRNYGQPYAVAKNLAAAFVRAEAKGGDLRVNGVHPGSVRTDMNPGGKLTPAESASDIAATLLSATENGVMYHRRKPMGW